MSALNTKSTIHARISNFVDWIAPEPDTRDIINEQITEIQKRICDKAEKDDIVVIATPKSGSFAKNTGLRRHMRGDSEIEGQDIDLPFVIKPLKAKSYELQPMIGRFTDYCKLSYPTSKREPTKSSVKLSFGNNLTYDIVPLFSTDDSEKQVLVRSTGEEIITSVQKHTEFMKSRTKQSKEIKGVVQFNECVRLLKWWRDVRCAGEGYLKEVPSILIDLLCAKAFDEKSVQSTYPQTLAEWFAFLAHVVKKREPVFFTDYVSGITIQQTDKWYVIDPVNPKNNIANKLQPFEVDELAGWFESARDSINQSIADDAMDDDNESLEELILMFGNPFKNHCGESEE